MENRNTLLSVQQLTELRKLKFYDFCKSHDVKSTCHWFVIKDNITSTYRQELYMGSAPDYFCHIENDVVTEIYPTFDYDTLIQVLPKTIHIAENEYTLMITDDYICYQHNDSILFQSHQSSHNLNCLFDMLKFYLAFVCTFIYR